MFMSVLQNYSA